VSKLFQKLDLKIIKTVRRISLPLARLAIFVVFFWFGLLKVFDLSPANLLVEALLQKTLPFISFEQFIIFLGFYEMFVGLIFLVPSLTRLAIALLIIHLITALLPLIFLPSVTWLGILTPTLEGQYIIKNLAITALAICLAAYVRPLQRRKDKGL